MLHQLLDQRQDIAAAVGGPGLQGEPLVDDQRFLAKHVVESPQRLRRKRVACGNKRCQRDETIGHVAGGCEILQGPARPGVGLTRAGVGRPRGQAQTGQRKTGQRSPPGGLRIRGIGAGILMGAQARFPFVLQCRRQLQAHCLAHFVNRLRIDHIHLLGQVGFGRQGKYQLLEGRVQPSVLEQLAQGRQVGLVQNIG